MPKTFLGKWAIRLIVAFFILFAVFQILVGIGQRGGDKFFDNMLLAIPGLLMAFSGIGSFFTGIVSIVKNKERSVLVFIATLVGLLILLFVLGEVVFPH
jgi:amino acid permease